MARTETKPISGLVGNVLGYADSVAARASDTVLLVGRLAMGIIFFQSSLAKLAALGAFSGSLGSRGVPFPGFLGPVGAISEFLGGAMIILGLGTRYAAGLIAIFGTIATAILHRYWSLLNRRGAYSKDNSIRTLQLLGGRYFCSFARQGVFRSIPYW